MDYQGLCEDLFAMDIRALEAIRIYPEQFREFMRFSIACSQFRAEIIGRDEGAIG